MARDSILLLLFFSMLTSCGLTGVEEQDNRKGIPAVASESSESTAARLEPFDTTMAISGEEAEFYLQIPAEVLRSMSLLSEVAMPTARRPSRPFTLTCDSDSDGDGYGDAIVSRAFLHLTLHKWSGELASSESVVLPYHCPIGVRAKVTASGLQVGSDYSLEARILDRNEQLRYVSKSDRFKADKGAKVRLVFSPVAPTNVELEIAIDFEQEPPPPEPCPIADCAMPENPTARYTCYAKFSDEKNSFPIIKLKASSFSESCAKNDLSYQICELSRKYPSGKGTFESCIKEPVPRPTPKPTPGPKPTPPPPEAEIEASAYLRDSLEPAQSVKVRVTKDSLLLGNSEIFVKLFDEPVKAVNGTFVFGTDDRRFAAVTSYHAAQRMLQFMSSVGFDTTGKQAVALELAKEVGRQINNALFIPGTQSSPPRMLIAPGDGTTLKNLQTDGDVTAWLVAQYALGDKFLPTGGDAVSIFNGLSDAMVALERNDSCFSRTVCTGREGICRSDKCLRNAKNDDHLLIERSTLRTEVVSGFVWDLFQASELDPKALASFIYKALAHLDDGAVSYRSLAEALMKEARLSDNEKLAGLVKDFAYRRGFFAVGPSDPLPPDPVDPGNGGADDGNNAEDGEDGNNDNDDDDDEVPLPPQEAPPAEAPPPAGD